MDITNRETIAQRLAETYQGSRLPNPWERVQEYQRVIEYTAEHPNLGSSAVSTRLELPRSRIRPWMDDGAKPDPVRALEIAEGYGWLDLENGAPPFEGLNILVAWIFAAGSLRGDYYVPSFTIPDESYEVLKTALELANAPPHRRERDDEDSRATEVFIADDGTVFGRLLSALGAPVGEKHDERQLELPLYLAQAPELTRLAFARTYVWHRGTQRDRENTPIQITEQRSKQYRRELQAFLNGLIAGAVHG